MARVICPHCGEVNSEGSAFCEQCGSRLPAAAAGPRRSYQGGYQDQGYPQAQVIRKSSGGKKWLIPVIIIALIAVGGGVFAFLHMSKPEPVEIDLVQNFDDRVLDLRGQDGEGIIEGVDYDKIRENLNYNDQTDEAKEFIDSVEYHTDMDSVNDLVNGDKVKVICEYNESKAEEYGLKVKNGNDGTVETTIKIERLEAKDVTIQESVNDLNENYDNSSGLDMASDENIRYTVSNEYLTEDDIAGMNDKALQRMINYIYANNGYEFQKPKTKAYFEALDWYNEVPNKTKNQTVAEGRFNKIEWANATLLEKRVKQLKAQD